MDNLGYVADSDNRKLELSWTISHWTPYTYLSDKLQLPYNNLGDKLWPSYTYLGDNLRTSYINLSDNLWISYITLGDNKHKDSEEKVQNKDENKYYHHFHHMHCDPEVFIHHIWQDKFSLTLNSPFKNYLGCCTNLNKTLGKSTLSIL